MAKTVLFERAPISTFSVNENRGYTVLQRSRISRRTASVRLNNSDLMSISVSPITKAIW